jgi:hypothetical protein
MLVIISSEDSDCMLAIVSSEDSDRMLMIFGSEDSDRWTTASSAGVESGGNHWPPSSLCDTPSLPTLSPLWS